jgi:hypothetical protein
MIFKQVQPNQAPLALNGCAGNLSHPPNIPAQVCTQFRHPLKLEI